MNKTETKSLVVVAILGFSLMGCSGQKSIANGSAKAVSERAEAKPGQVVFAENSPQLLQIRSEAVKSSLVPVGSVSAPGKVEANANRLSHVVLPLTGRVTSVLVKIGDTVSQGQSLLTIESADVDAAVASLQQALAIVTQAKSALAKANMDLDRVKDLYEHGAVPQKDLLNSQAITVQAQASVDQTLAAVEQARRRLQIFGVGPGAYGQGITIRAPISGKVLEMSVVNGEFRNDLSTSLMTIADLSAVWVTSDVSETAIRFIKLGEPVQIELAAYPGEIFRGKVALIGDTVDPQTRTVKVRAELSNSNGRLKPEMFGKIQLAEGAEQLPTIPAAAVISANGKSLVWREISKGTYEKVSVTLGATMGDRIAVLTGLKAEDRIVVDGVMLLTAK